MFQLGGSIRFILTSTTNNTTEKKKTFLTLSGRCCPLTVFPYDVESGLSNLSQGPPTSDAIP